MSISDKLPRGIRRLFRLPASYRRQLADLDEEIRFHIETHVERLRAEGMSLEDAMAATLQRFGDSDDLREYCAKIAARREPGRALRQWFDELGQDFRFALRQIRRAPGFAATAVLILAVGIGATTGVYSIVHHLLIAPLPFHDGNRMVTFRSMTGGGRVSVSPDRQILEAWRDRSTTVEQALIYDDAYFTLGDSTREATTELVGVAVPPSIFRFLGVQPERGRPIVATDTLADATPVALLSESVWQSRFGRTDVVGTQILLNGTMHTVIGVMPAGFVVPFADGRDIVTALRHGAASTRAVVGRPAGLAKLRSGVSVADANRELAALFPAKSDLNAYDEPPKVARQLDLVGRSIKRIVLGLFGAVALVLLIACANVANLLLGRSWSRQREFAVRTALGAGRWRIARQVLTESLMMSLLAGVLGAAFSFFVLNVVRAAMPNGNRFDDVRIDGSILLASVALSAFTGLLFGVAPAFVASKSNTNDSLKAGSRSATGNSNMRRLRSGLVATEIALSMVLLTGVGLLVRTLVALDRVDVGFQSHGLAAGSVRLTSRALADTAARSAALSSAITAVRAIPGIRGALMTQSTPPDYGIIMGGLEIDGRSIAPSESLQTMGYAMVPPDFFAFTGIPIQQGRSFSPATAADAKSEVIINATLARRLWPNGGALGARIRRAHEQQLRTVVGIVGDVRLPARDAANPKLNQDLQLYLPLPAVPAFVVDLMMRTDLPIASLETSINQALHNAHPALKITGLTTSDAVIEQSTASQHFVLRLLTIFATFAILLAVVGLNAVMSYDVNQRTREIGVRVALGAQSTDVTRLIIGRSLGVAAIGVILGIAAAVAGTRALGALLYGVHPSDPLTLSIVSFALLGAAALATYAPARRAARIDPVDALRAD